MGIKYGPLPPVVVPGAAVWYDFLDPTCFTTESGTATNLGTLTITASFPSGGAGWRISNNDPASGDHMNMGAGTGTFSATGIEQDNMSYEFWLYVTDIQDGCNTSVGYLGTGVCGDASSHVGCQLHWIGDTGGHAAWYLRGAKYAPAGDTRGAINGPGNTITYSTWQHHVITFEGATCSLYTNGSFVQSYTICAAATSDGVLLGPPYGLSDNNMDIWRIYHSILTPAEILNNFNVDKSRFGL